MDNQEYTPNDPFNFGYHITRCGKIINCSNNRMLKQTVDKDGYLKVVLNNKSKRKYLRSHRLVAMVYLRNPENKPCVNHIDFNRQNNNVENLSWTTHYENEHHTIRSGRKRYAKGKSHGRRKLEPWQVPLIKEISLKTSISDKCVGKIFNISPAQVGRIRRGENWN